MNKDLSDKEIEDINNLTSKVLAEICRISDAHNIDRDSALKYFADILTVFTEVATIQNYDSKQTNADRIRSMTDEELADFIINFENRFGEEYDGEQSCLSWLQKESEEQ